MERVRSPPPCSRQLPCGTQPCSLPSFSVWPRNWAPSALPREMTGIGTASLGELAAGPARTPAASRKPWGQEWVPQCTQDAFWGSLLCTSLHFGQQWSHQLLEAVRRLQTCSLQGPWKASLPAPAPLASALLRPRPSSCLSSFWPRAEASPGFSGKRPGIRGREEGGTQKSGPCQASSELGRGWGPQSGVCSAPAGPGRPWAACHPGALCLSSCSEEG